MNLGRFFQVLSLESRILAARPMVWVLISILVLLSFGMSTGGVIIASGDSQVGGMKAYVTSQFAIGQILAIIVFTFYAFFIAIAAGMSVIQDDEYKIGEILHATALRPSEYIGGKFAANVLVFSGVLLIHMLTSILFNHIIPNSEAVDIRGPFRIANYLLPALYFGMPQILFVSGISLFMGERFRKPVLVFFFPVATMLFALFFLWEWSPSWLPVFWNRVLMYLDPSGFRWLNEIWLKTDRGVQFYNSAPIGWDLVFLLNRLTLVLGSFGLLGLTIRHFSSTLRGVRSRVTIRANAVPEQLLTPVSATSLRTLNMTGAVPGFLSSTWNMFRVELREIRSQAGLYLFIPLIALQTFSIGMFSSAAFDSRNIVTSGFFAQRTMGSLTVFLCLLLLFYIVESMHRETATRFAPLFHATPVRSSSILLGKLAALLTIVLTVFLIVMLSGIAAILYDGIATITFLPFFLVWGVLLIPTFIFWIALIMLISTVFKSRYAVYAIGIGVLLLNAYVQYKRYMNWVFNWNLWAVVIWSDMSVLEMDRLALILNRSLILVTAMLLFRLAVACYTRYETDPVSTLNAFRPGSLSRGILRWTPWLAAPLTLGIVLGVLVMKGTGGGVMDKKARDYWRKNVATWTGSTPPDVTHISLDVSIEPERSYFKMNGEYIVTNTHDEPAHTLPFTSGFHWRNVSWRMNGEKTEPEDSAGLMIFKPEAPLERDQTVTIGFEYDGFWPDGISKNGGGSMEFILNSGVVLTSFSPSFVPVPGYMEEIGVDEKNEYDSKKFPDDFFEGRTDVMIGSNSPFTTHITIHGPEDFIFNSVGVLESDTVENGQRRMVWASDHPVRFYNIVGGRLVVRKGNGTALYHHPTHTYNIDEISAALDHCRHYYSEWFGPFPWSELKITEFPGVAYYAQGFPTNISFSEKIGFLTQDTPGSNSAFLVTAHESAHQWWANILTPGKGPGGNVIAEGMAQCSTMMLSEQVFGDAARRTFARRLEIEYSDQRQQDSERSLNRIDGTRPGDQTTTYNKGGWVFYMLIDLMGRDAFLEGQRDFIETYQNGPDYPVIEDFVRVMRTHAPDPDAFDRYCNQWFFDVVAPEYTISNPARNPGETGDIHVVTAEITNIGTGDMAVTVAAAIGEPYDKDSKPIDGYQVAGTTVRIPPGDAVPVRIECPFEPDRIVVDPDIRVMQLRRKFAVHTF